MNSIRDLIDASPMMLIALGFALGLLPLLDARSNHHRLIVIALFAFATVRYYIWRVSGVVQYGHYDGADGAFAWPALGFEMLGLCEAILAVILLSRIVDRKPESNIHAAILAARPCAEYATVDVFIATYNEGIDILEKTILGALTLDWPADKLKIWLLDDSRRDWLSDYCTEKNVGYLRRDNNAHAKAGNINAAIKVTSGDFIAVFDADFVPRHNFLTRTIGWFDEPGIGIVQVPHHFYNADPIQANLLLDGILPDDQRMFFDVIQPSRDAWDAAFCCGSCGVLRRAAVVAIGGGIPTASITEDILCTLAMKRQGYITRFVNEQLAFGLAAESVEAFFVQRKRWLRGGIQMLFLRDGPFGPGHRFIDRLLFFPASWIGQYSVRVFGFALPVICLWSNLNPLPGATTVDVLSYQAPMFIAFFAMMRWLAPKHHIALLSEASQCFASFRLTPTLLASLIKPFGTPFKVTPKGVAAGLSQFDRTTFYTAAAFFSATVLGVAANVFPQGGPSTGFFPIVMCWSFWNLVTLGIVLMMCFETPRRRMEERFGADEPTMLRLPIGAIPATAVDYSLSGARLRLPSSDPLQPDRRLMVAITGIGEVPATVIGQDHDLLRVAFTWRDLAQRDAMIIKLFASGQHPAGLQSSSSFQLLLATWRRMFMMTWLDGNSRQPVVSGSAPLEDISAGKLR
jgi:cellulose synthase (UDP-forming)